MTESSHVRRAYSTQNYTITSQKLSRVIRSLKRDFPAFDKRDRRNILVMSRYIDGFTYRQVTFRFNAKLRRVK